jgi:phosphate acetyltransferase
VLPEGNDKRIVKAAGEVLARGLAKLTILGNPDEVAKIANEEGVSLAGATIIDQATANIDDMVASLVESRKSSGMTADKAKELLRDYTWFGTLMIHTGKVDGMVSGANTSTADTMRPALQVIKAAPGFSSVSSSFFMLLNGGVKFYSDCGLIPNPTTDEMAEIACATADTARAFGLAPRIAMLSYATGSADKGDMIDKVREATAKAKAKRPNEFIEGPIQYDAAVDPRVADVKFKGKPGEVAGRASVLIMPDLDAGNIAYKVAQQSSKCVAIGPIMQGLNKPVNDLSRGCTVDDVVHCVVVTALQSIAAKKRAPASKL